MKRCHLIDEEGREGTVSGEWWKIGLMPTQAIIPIPLEIMGLKSERTNVLGMGYSVVVSRVCQTRREGRVTRTKQRQIGIGQHLISGQSVRLYPGDYKSPT
jgi:hypothetical protein